MTNTELALNMLAEAATTELSKEKNPQHLEEHHHHHSRAQHSCFQARKELRSEGEITDNKNLLKFKDYAKRKEA